MSFNQRSEIKKNKFKEDMKDEILFEKNLNFL